MAINKEIELKKFLENIEDRWKELRSGTSKAANAKVKANDRLAKKWLEAGVAVELLLPLLEYDSNAVKLSAAAYLLNTEKKTLAISVLRSLNMHDRSGIGLMAGAVLRLNKVSKEPDVNEISIMH